MRWHNFKASLICDALWENERKIQGGRMWERIIFVNLQACISQLHSKLTSSQIIFKWTPSKGYFSLLYKILEKHLGNSFSLYMLADTLQLVDEISSLLEVFYKNGIPKNFSKFRDKQKKQSSVKKVFFSKRCSLKFNKIHRKTSVSESLF